MDQARAIGDDDRFMPFRIDGFRGIRGPKKAVSLAVTADVRKVATFVRVNLELVTARVKARQPDRTVLDAGIAAEEPEAKASFKIRDVAVVPEQSAGGAAAPLAAGNHSIAHSPHSRVKIPAFEVTAIEHFDKTGGRTRKEACRRGSAPTEQPKDKPAESKCEYQQDWNSNGHPYRESCFRRRRYRGFVHK